MGTKSSNTVPNIKVEMPGTNVALPYGAVAYVFQRGADLFEQTEVGGPVEIEFKDGAVRQGIVQSLKADVLIDLLPSCGPQSMHCYGRTYTGAAVVKAMTKQANVEVLDVTKLYTAVGVQLMHPVEDNAL